MFNYQINVEYLGTNYVGWQIQKNGISVQSIVQKALSKVLKSKISIVGSGRTDSGVHAKAQSANFFSNSCTLYELFLKFSKPCLNKTPPFMNMDLTCLSTSLSINS